MGTLGRYLQDARQARGIDLRDAAQQTRISIHFLKALEEEDFSKLPGKVFVKGFLKSYAKFLRLDENAVMALYEESGQKQSPASAPVPPESSETEAGQSRSAKIPIEPFLWGAGIVVLLVLFLFTAVPKRPPKETQQAGESAPAGRTELSSTPVPTSIPEKLYLEVIALENTWVLVRTDTSPQKKAVLNKGESLIWSASERFLLSFGSAGAVKLLLNGQELIVDEPKNAVIRDLTITASGIVDRKIPTERTRPAKPKPAAQTRSAEQVPSSATITGAQHASEPAPQPKIQPRHQPLIQPQQQQQPQLPQPLAPAPRNLP
jgi:hypothetical protein